LNKDAIRDGMRFTSGAGSTNEALVWEVLYRTVEQWLEGQVSLILDFTTYEGVTEEELTQRVMTRGHLLNVHCSAANALDRFEARIETHPHFRPDRRRAADQRQKAAAAEERWRRPLSLGCPVLEVDTTTGYVPDVAAIERWVLDRSDRLLPLQATRR
jgi:hypothetical protein